MDKLIHWYNVKRPTYPWT